MLSVFEDRGKDSVPFVEIRIIFYSVNTIQPCFLDLNSIFSQGVNLLFQDRQSPVFLRKEE